MTVSIDRAARVQPSPRQVAFQEMEFYAFVHFSMNTFTGQEWGSGQDEPSIFHPTAFDANQWVAACQAAGMTGLILTCKHHDGFCLWPSQYTDYSVKNSPWKNGEGDIVREVADACQRMGMKFGVYLSPWDRHETTYGDSPAYNQFFLNQLRELLTAYGDIFCVWFDGACGEGPNGKRQQYDWDSYFSLIRELQPNAVISVCGPDVRWCGNEAGHCRTSEWSVVPASVADNEKIQEKSQQEDNREFATNYSSSEEDLGSRAIIANEQHLIWYPAEVNTSIRPGWFYHQEEDEKVKSLDELLRVYYGSVGGNASFLLNIPPDRRGLFHEHDVQRLRQLGDKLRHIFAQDLAEGKMATATEEKLGYNAQHVLVTDKEKYWAPEEGTESAAITIDLGEQLLFDHVVLQEHYMSQRVEKFELAYENTAGQFVTLYVGTIIGRKRICEVPATTARKLRMTILQSRWWPNIASIQVYNSTI
ncbi:alpha-L-fucosidase [Paenibacillus yanchengensis]|uniref:alpha-L-fucosidase n=1 Tax=Paenibacillus yanchengensis TaxID=2035833 RepID=A0ABW4YKH4_9BACL